MTLALALTFVPSYAVLPAYMGLDAIAISPRFPRNGFLSAGPASGITGVAGRIIPPRSVVEAQQIGATVALWCYTDLASSNGYASAAQFVAEFQAAGIPIQTTTNNQPTDLDIGPFCKDAGGTDWKGGVVPNRPALNIGSPSPALSRIELGNSFGPAADAGTKTAKLSTLAAQRAISGIFGVQYDDPRATASFAGSMGITSTYDTSGQGCDFSPSALTGFTAWLEANTTSAERIAVGLPSSTSGFDFLVWLRANKAAIMFSPNQVDPAAVDNHLFRTSVSADQSLRVIYLRWMGRFLREDHIAHFAGVKAQGGLLSLNFYEGTPSEQMSWPVRRAGTAGLWDFAVSEIAGNYWADLSPHAVGSAAYFDVRMIHAGKHSLTMATHDMCGLRGFIENKPTSLTGAPPRVVVQTLRQSMIDIIARGGVSIAPLDIFMGIESGNRQGVDIEGYRYWAEQSSYVDIFSFVRANRTAIAGHEKLAVVHVAMHGDSFPFQDGGSAARYTTICGRLGALDLAGVPYHILPLGAATGVMPVEPKISVLTTAPLILRVQPRDEYFAQLGSLSGNNCREWSASAIREAQQYSPCRSTNPYVRAHARYNAATRRMSVHLVNYQVNSNGTPKSETTILRWNPAFGTPTGPVTVTRLGEAAGTVDLSQGFAQVTLREYAIVNFAVG